MVNPWSSNLHHAHLLTSSAWYEMTCASSGTKAVSSSISAMQFSRDSACAGVAEAIIYLWLNSYRPLVSRPWTWTSEDANNTHAGRRLREGGGETIEAHGASRCLGRKHNPFFLCFYRAALLHLAPESSLSADKASHRTHERNETIARLGQPQGPTPQPP
jgi:hypothetical protein